MTTNASLSTATFQTLDSKHYLHPFTDHKRLAVKGARIITHAAGVYLWDSDGNQILDGMSGLWCVNIGYGRPELAAAAEKQLRQLSYYNSFFQTSHPAAIALASELANLTPLGFNHSFFVNSGSEAADTVIRMVRRYWEIAGQPDRNVIIARENGYHGSTMGGASLGGMKFIHAQGGLPIPGIEHVMQPYEYRLNTDQSVEEFGLLAARCLEERILALGAERVAAFIAEPVQGAGGVIVPPASYWPEIQRICRLYDILLVVDEVICGFGRTGKWFGTDFYQLQPDLMMIAKGLSSGYMPIGAVMVADRVATALIDNGGEFFHGFTYSGHPAACAVALENLRLLREENIIERCDAEIVPYFQRRIRELGEHPLVGEVRGIGMMAALEMTPNKSTRARFYNPGRVGILSRDHSLNAGLMMRSVVDTMVLAPPLIISKSQIDELVDKVQRALNATAHECGLL